MAGINFSVRKPFRTSGGAVSNARGWTYKYKPRSTVVRDIYGGLTLPPDLVLKSQEHIRAQIRARISEYVTHATDPETGVLRNETLVKVSTKIYFQLLQSLGPKVCKRMGLSPNRIMKVFQDRGLVSDVTLSQKIAGYANKVKILQLKNQLMQSLASADELKKVYEVICDTIIKLKIASGAAVYRVRKAGKGTGYVLKCVMRKMGENIISRYFEYKEPKGEKAQIVYVHEVLKKEIDVLDSPFRQDNIQKQDRMKSWHIVNRREWLEWGMTGDILIKISEALTNKGIDALITLAGSNQSAQDLARDLIEMEKNERYLVDEQIDARGAEILKAHLSAVKKGSEDEEAILKKTYDAVIEGIKGIRREVSAEVFSAAETIALKWANENKNRDYSSLFTQVVFEHTVRHYIEALQDIENDLKQLRGKDPKCTFEDIKENFYYVVVDTEYAPIALVLANNQGDIGQGKREKRPGMFNDEAQKADAIDFYSQINPILALTLLHREAAEQLALSKNNLEKALKTEKLDAEHQRQLFNLSTILMGTDESNLEKTLNQAVVIIRDLLKTNGESIFSTILKEAGERMEIVATATTVKADDKDKEKIMSAGGTINKGRIVSWVIKNAKTVFVFGGKAFIGGEKHSKEDISRKKAEFLAKLAKIEIEIGKCADENEKKKLIEEQNNILMNIAFYEKLESIIDDPTESLMCAPIILSGQVWIQNLRGVAMNEKAMNTLMTALDIESATIRATLLTRELKSRTEELNSQNVKLQETIKEKDQLFEQAQSLNNRLIEANKRSEEIRRIDGLTGLMRRETAFEALPGVIESAMKNKIDMAVMVIDIDWFKKKVNDLYGHTIGDVVLAAVARALKEQIGANGEIARYGGEEFLSWMPLYSKALANERWGKILKHIENMDIDIGEGRHIRVTLSVGIVSLKEDYFPDEKNALTRLIERSDEAMYAAKAAGRNRRYMYNKDVADGLVKNRAEIKEKDEKQRRAEETEALKMRKLTEAQKILNELSEVLNTPENGVFDIEKAKKLRDAAASLIAEAESLQV